MNIQKINQFDNLDIKYGLVVTYKDNPDEIVHFCGYESKPGKNDILSFKNEIKNDESFNLTQDYNDLIFRFANDDEINFFKKIISEENNEISENINIPIEIGDIIYGGRFKNKKIVVKEISKDDNNQITINGKPMLKFKIDKTLPKKKINECKDGEYMIKSNIKSILRSAQYLSEKIENETEFEDWVKDHISRTEQFLSDIHDFYKNKLNDKNYHEIVNFEKFNESIYSNISKSIGWDERNVKIPSIEDSKMLVKLAEDEDDINAFKTIFSIVRFGKTNNEKDVESMNILYSSFSKLKNKYQ
jgi:hypothetical protein